MKKFLFLVMVLAVSTSTFAQNPGDIPVDPPSGPIPKSPTDLLEVKAFYTSDTLTVNITGYYGDVEVTVEEAVSGTVEITQTEYVSWQASITTDIHSLDVGNYILYIRLDNDDEYVGYFSK